MRGMEFIASKRSKSRKKRRHVKKRRREQIKLEVRLSKRQRLVPERSTRSCAPDKLPVSAMQADAFWKNYNAAQEWQKRHNVVWWKSRCIALEYENQILRDKVRSLAHQDNRRITCNDKSNNHYSVTREHNNVKEEDEFDVDNESIEFQINEDLMSFLEQSIRHKVELKEKREIDLAAKEKEKEDEFATIQGGAAWTRARNSNAKLLYGEASPRILAMETALEATTNRHKDKARPQYWPNIPLRL